jgi:Ca2+/Na+ antiporter
MDKSVIQFILLLVLLFCCGLYHYFSYKHEVARRKAFLKKLDEDYKNHEFIDEESSQGEELSQIGLDDTTVNYLITKAEAEDKTPAEIIEEMVRERQSAAA